MKLFDGFEAVKFPNENMIFITRNGYLYYIYKHKYNVWKKHRYAGYDSITVKNYQDISKKELKDAMNGTFPRKETDFMRLCNSEQLCIRDMMELLDEDYHECMSYYPVRNAIHKLLLKSGVTHKSYTKIRKILDKATERHQDKEQVFEDMKVLCSLVLGRDLFTEKIEIVDGHDSSSYFWIMPVRVIDDSNTNDTDNIAEMRAIEISIEEMTIDKYLASFLIKHFDDELDVNKKRFDNYWTDEEGEHGTVLSGFKWYLTYNFYTFDSVLNILKDINDTIDALSDGIGTEFTAELKDEDTESVIDFYRRFTYRMEYMMKVGKENGYELISFMGP